MEEVIVGVVGTLQFDVLEYRLRSEYNVELYKEGLPYEYLRWIVKEDEDAQPLKEEDLLLPNDAKLVEDYKGNQLLRPSSFSPTWTAPCSTRKSISPPAAAPPWSAPLRPAPRWSLPPAGFLGACPTF